MAVPDSTLKSTVKEKYAQAALRVSEGSTAATCCGSGACCGATTETWDPITSELYDDQRRTSPRQPLSLDTKARRVFARNESQIRRNA